MDEHHTEVWYRSRLLRRLVLDMEAVHREQLIDVWQRWVMQVVDFLELLEEQGVHAAASTGLPLGVSGSFFRDTPCSFGATLMMQGMAWGHKAMRPTHPTSRVDWSSATP